MELKKKMVAALCKAYPHVSENTIKCAVREYKTERGLNNHLSRVNAENEARHNEPLPVYIEVEVSWSKNRTWGYNPTASVRWEDEQGHWHYREKVGGASGWGYDKHSSAVASALNECFKNLLYKARKKKLSQAPYGLSHYTGSFPHFEGGVGMSCYPSVFEWLGYKMQHTVNADKFDLWTITSKRRLAHKI